MKVIREYKIEEFKGLLTETTDLREIPDGYSPDSLNWLTQINKEGIELRRGTALLGTTRNQGTGKITGLGVGTRFDGHQVPFFSYGRKIKYYDEDADDTQEVGTDLLPAAADGEDVSINPYQNISGAFVFLSSPSSSIYKIPVANPGSAVDQQSTTYRGFFKFGQSRGFLFNRHGATAGNKDQMGLYASAVDKVDLTQYPAQVTGEAVGASGSTNYAHDLTQITGKRTAMFVQVEATVAAGTETFVDDKNGGLLSNFGGTGTINYATGELEVDFSDVTTGAVTASYYYEDSTDGGVVDFDIQDPSDRQPGEGNYFPQFDGGGLLKSVYPLATVFYCFHEKKTWQVSIPVDDESGTDSISTNLPFREKMGVKSQYGAFGGEKGIYFINTADPQKPVFMRLELYAGATSANIALPKELSKAVINFSGYAFDNAVVFEWGDYVVLCCQQIRNGVADTYNSRMFVYNKENEIWDLCDNPASVLGEYEGTLIAGDPISNNVFTLFSGFDDDDNLIPNYWTDGDHDFDIDGTKRFSRMALEGLIQQSQSYKVQLAFDDGSFVDVFTLEGDGDYVNVGKTIAVGSHTVGSKTSGGGQTVLAHPYQVEFKVQTPRFKYVRVRFEALSGGYVSIKSYSFKDIREKGGRLLPEHTDTV